MTYAGTVSPEDLVTIIEATGYIAALPVPKLGTASAAGPGDAEQDEKDDEVSRLRQRLVISAGAEPAGAVDVDGPDAAVRREEHPGQTVNV